MDEEKKKKKQKEVHDRILDAALEAIAQHKISGTRVRLIADQAGISHGHLHYYFDSKKELMLDLLDNIIETFHSSREEALENTEFEGIDRLNVFFQQKKESIIQKKIPVTLFDFWVQGTIDETIRKKMQSSYISWSADIKELLGEAAAKGTVSKKYIDILPYLMISIMDGAAIQYILNEESFDLDSYFELSGDIIQQLLSKT